MALQSSASGADPLKLSEIKTEFSGPNNLRAYLNGGTYVPSSPLNSGIPSSGTLSILDFLSSSAGIGTVNIPSTFTAYTARTGLVFSQSVSTSLSMRTDTTYLPSIDSVNVPANWLTGSDAWAGGWQLRFTLTNNYGGSASLLTFTNTSNNTWTTVTTNQTVTLSATLDAGMTETKNILVEARKVGTTTVVDSGTLTLYISYEQTGGGCSTCCFTPDTLITMADMSTRRIDEIQIGDEILVYNQITATNESQKVTGVITRIERPMYQYVLEGNKILNASEEHPLYVIGKGYSAMVPVDNYKHTLEKVHQIEVGDAVQLENGSVKILEINPIYYPETVYTLENCEFYANEVLVY